MLPATSSLNLTVTPKLPVFKTEGSDVKGSQILFLFVVEDILCQLVSGRHKSSAKASFASQKLWQVIICLHHISARVNGAYLIRPVVGSRAGCGVLGTGGGGDPYNSRLKVMRELDRYDTRVGPMR